MLRSVRAKLHCVVKQNAQIKSHFQINVESTIFVRPCIFSELPLFCVFSSALSRFFPGLTVLFCVIAFVSLLTTQHLHSAAFSSQILHQSIASTTFVVNRELSQELSFIYLFFPLLCLLSLVQFCCCKKPTWSTATDRYDPCNRKLSIKRIR